jgi:hypothetical protein
VKAQGLKKMADGLIAFVSTSRVFSQLTSASPGLTAEATATKPNDVRAPSRISSAACRKFLPGCVVRSA